MVATRSFTFCPSGGLSLSSFSLLSLSWFLSLVWSLILEEPGGGLGLGL
jgi:hypothetical protein